MMRNDWTLPGKIYLLERDPVKCGFLRLYFDRAPEAETVQDGFRHFMETHAVQCVVSPANAFGLMDGGYDSAITEWFGRQLQRRVQQYILDHFRGEQPVGTSFLLEAGRDVMLLLVGGAFDEVHALLREDVAEGVTAEDLQSLTLRQLDGAGVYKQIESSMVTGQSSGGEDYGVAVLYCRFAKDRVLFRLAFDPDLALIGLEIRKQ